MNQKEFEFNLLRIENNIAKGIKLTDKDKKFMVNVFVATWLMYGFLGFILLLGTVDLDYLMENMKNEPK